MKAIGFTQSLAITEQDSLFEFETNLPELKGNDLLVKMSLWVLWSTNPFNSLKELLTHLELDINNNLRECPLFNGGPVQKERGFILHFGDQEWETAINIGDNINLTDSKDILIDIANNKGPENIIIALGYAGWDSGQLKAEYAANHWLTVPTDQELIFETAHEKQWIKTTKKLGVDLNLISNQIGHA